MGRIFYKTERDELAFGVMPAYRRFELYHARYHEMLPVVEPLLRERASPLRILDVGSGNGLAKRFLDRLGGHTRWVGVELDPSRVAECHRLGYAQVLSEVDLEQQPLPLEDGSFDLVIASHVLEHLSNAREALADWYRLLAPGGALLLGVPMHLGPVAALARLRYRLRGRRPRGHCHFFTLSSLRSFLAGYRVERVWGFRVLSACRQLPLEDWEWFYRWSRWAGRRFPGLTAEVNVHLVRPASDAQMGRPHGPYRDSKPAAEGPSPQRANAQ